MHVFSTCNLYNFTCIIINFHLCWQFNTCISILLQVIRVKFGITIIKQFWEFRRTNKFFYINFEIKIRAFDNCYFFSSKMWRTLGEGSEICDSLWYDEGVKICEKQSDILYGQPQGRNYFVIFTLMYSNCLSLNYGCQQLSVYTFNRPIVAKRKITIKSG